MNQSVFKKLLPHGIAIVVFILAAIIIGKTSLQSGMVLNQGDIAGWKGMAQQSFQYKNEHGHYPLWTTSMFGGMPGYTIAMDGPWTLARILHPIFTLGLPKPLNFFFLACISFYFLALCLRIKPYVAIIGALGFAYATYTPIIIGAGHETKMLALAYLPALLGSMLLIYEKRYLWGFILTAVFTMLEINMNHQQVSYYFFLVAGILTLFQIIKWVKEKDWAHLGKSLALVAIAGLLGLMVNAVSLLTVYDYAKYSKRGGQLILDNDNKEAKKTNGLSEEYAFQWSYGKSETFTLMFPGVYGYGSKGAELGENSHVAKYLEDKAGQSEDQATQMASSLSGALYWGDQPFTEGPVYLGAVICFLFIFAMVYLKSYHKWWILTACIIAVLMAWGKNFPAFNGFLFDHLPMYNKFRSPSMILIIPQLLFPLAGVMALQQLLNSKDNLIGFQKIIKPTVIITVAVFAIAIVMYMSADYKDENRSRTEAFNQLMASKGADINARYAELNKNYTPQKDNQLYENILSSTGGNTEIAKGLLKALRDDRAAIFGKDILRSLLFVALTFGLILLYTKNKLKADYMLAGIILLTFVDLYLLDKSYLNENNYIEQDAYESDLFPLTEADRAILQDKDPNYRVFNTASGRDPFQESATSYYHKSIGGYSPAKIGIYDDLITYQLQGSPNIQVINMLNTKYLIQKNPQDGKTMAIPNPEALGNCWIVKGVRYVKDPAAEMKALHQFSAKDTAIVEEAFKHLLPANSTYDSTASIKQVQFDNDAIRYESVTKNPQIAIFSEIYYAGGWDAYIDDKPVDYFKANYVLRGIVVPAGKHTIDFKFEPKSYKMGVSLTKISSIIILLVLAGGILITWRKRSV